MDRIGNDTSSVVAALLSIIHRRFLWESDAIEILLIDIALLGDGIIEPGEIPLRLTHLQRLRSMGSLHLLVLGLSKGLLLVVGLDLQVGVRVPGDSSV